MAEMAMSTSPPSMPTAAAAPFPADSPTSSATPHNASKQPPSSVGVGLFPKSSESRSGVITVVSWTMKAPRLALVVRIPKIWKLEPRKRYAPSSSPARRAGLSSASALSLLDPPSPSATAGDASPLRRFENSSEAIPRAVEDTI
eukprot:scaffold1744_cov129-Isochrysis_galbana.AAC.5